MPNTALIFSDIGLQHLVPTGHPERPERLRAIEDAFDRVGLAPPRVDAQKASMEELLRVHTQDHIDRIRETCEHSLPYPDPDTFMGPGSWDAALYAAGAAIEACKAVIDGRHARVFSAMRPPGHHAEADRAMGFCLFNQIAVAARWLQSEYQVDRIAIFDFDVHHGNGTQHSFYDEPTVYYASIHQWPLYPGTGRPEERGADGTNLNITMAPGTDPDEWIDAVATTVLPELERFQPDFLLLSAGFDAHREDPLAQQNLEAAHFAEITRRVTHLAGGRVVSIMEGGYNLEALGESAVAHFQALAE